MGRKMRIWKFEAKEDEVNELLNLIDLAIKNPTGGGVAVAGAATHWLKKIHEANMANLSVVADKKEGSVNG